MRCVDYLLPLVNDKRVNYLQATRIANHMKMDRCILKISAATKTVGSSMTEGTVWYEYLQPRRSQFSPASTVTFWGFFHVAILLNDHRL